MAGNLLFPDIQGMDFGEKELESGTRIQEYKSLEEEVPGDLIIEKSEGQEYPRYYYLHGIRHPNNDDIHNSLHYIPNVSPTEYSSFFSNISLHTEPFVVLAARRFEKSHNIIMNGSFSKKRVLFADNGDVEEVVIDSLSQIGNFEEFVFQEVI